MTSAELISELVPGMAVQEALLAFLAACNRRDTLFITERWFAPRKEQLLALLSDPITSDEAHGLRELLWQRIPFQVFFDWLAEKPVSWNDYHCIKAAEAKSRRWRVMAEGIFPWADVEGSRADAEIQKNGPDWEPACLRERGGGLSDRPPDPHVPRAAAGCPCCNAPLTWIHFRSPAWTWRTLHGREGWLGVCDRCHLQVDFSVVVMN